MLARRFVVVSGIVAAVIVAPASAAPRPDIATQSWELDVTFHDPQRIEVRHPGDASDTTYWYMVFTVTNNTGRDVPFFPSFRLVTDTLTRVDGGDHIPPSVYEAIEKRHDREYPFMAPMPKVTGLLLQGEENARSSVAIFRDFDPKASNFVVYVSGLSGEAERVANPNFDPTKPVSKENARAYVLRRTLAIEYDFPGDEVTRAMAKPTRRARTWVMR